MVAMDSFDCESESNGFVFVLRFCFALARGSFLDPSLCDRCDKCLIPVRRTHTGQFLRIRQYGHTYEPKERDKVAASQ
jgi:hypothetical protein